MAGAVIGIGGAVVYTSGSGRQLPAPGTAQGDLLFSARTKGDSNAPVTIFEVSDFQCPFCRTFWEGTKPALQREYIDPGKAQLVFINFPIPELHPNALAAHLFAMCAAREGHFWEVHDLLFERQREWGPLSDPLDYFLEMAAATPLPSDVMASCVRTGATRSLVEADLTAARRGGVNSTPSFVVEGGLIVGALTIEDWRPFLDSVYAEKTKG